MFPRAIVRSVRPVFFAAVAALPCALASAQGTIPDYDFQWARITHTNNAPYTGFIYQTPNNRGVVSYEYRMSKLEVTTAQWVEFFNAVAPLDRELALSLLPSISGAAPDSTFQHMNLSSDPDQANSPVIGISWRAAARYANWLHNDKQPTLAAISSGVYDTSTFGDIIIDGRYIGFTDNLSHAPDAKFWIPSFDEWLKATYYDPNRHGLGQEGWWMWPNSMDRQPIYGPPGVGESSERMLSDSLIGYRVGSYPQSQSPWGLFDTSGGVTEWMSDPGVTDIGVTVAGSGAAALEGRFDQIGFASESTVRFSGTTGLRLASAVPSGGGAALLLVAMGLWPLKRSNRCAS